MHNDRNNEDKCHVAISEDPVKFTDFMLPVLKNSIFLNYYLYHVPYSNFIEHLR